MRCLFNQIVVVIVVVVVAGCCRWVSRRFEDGSWGVVGKNKPVKFPSKETRFSWVACSTSLIAMCNGDDLVPIKVPFSQLLLRPMNGWLNNIPIELC